jgi:hypothetical protein
VPLNETCCGLLPPLSLTTTSALKRPGLPGGLKVTVIVHDPSAPYPLPQVLVWEKAEAPEPVIAMLLMLKAVLPTLVRVIAFCCPLEPKLRLDGVVLYIAMGNRALHGVDPSDAQAAPNSAARDQEAPVGQNPVASGSGNSSLHSSAPLSVSHSHSTIQGKVWVVSVADPSHVTFPPPNRPPDATFTTGGIAYMGWEPDNCYTLASFLAECANRGFELHFSGIPNSHLGGSAAGADTSMSGRTWGVLVEFTGSASLADGQEITILHDDGVALKIDGQPIPGFDPFVTAPVVESATFKGPAGVHSFDVLYANAAGSGAWLLFYPALY